MKYLIYFIYLIAFFVLLEIVKSIYKYSIRKRKKQEKISKLCSEFTGRFGNRTFDRNLSLEERNNDIILYYFDKITIDQILKYETLVLNEGLAISCINDIAIAEENFDMVVDDYGLGYWSKFQANDKYLTLINAIREKFYKRECELWKLDNSRKEVEIESRFQQIKTKHNNLFQKFFELTEKEVSLTDDYGDENFDAVSKQIELIIAKIAKKEGYPIKQIDNWLNYWREDEYESSYFPPKEMELLKKFLEESFQKYHAEIRKSESNRVTI